MTQPGYSSQAPASKVRRLLLPLSLALNLLLIGLIAGAALTGPERHPHRALDLSLGPLTRALTESDRAAVNASLRADITQQRPRGLSRDARRAELQRMLSALRAEPFDAAQLDAYLSEQRARADRWGAAGQSALIARLDQMSAVERAAYADRLERDLVQRERMHHDRDERHR